PLMLLRGWFHMSARRQDERRAPLDQPVGERPGLLPILQLDVDDGDVEAPPIAAINGFLERFTGADHVMAKRFEKILEHHGNEGLVFDDEDRSSVRHVPDLARGGQRKSPIWRARHEPFRRVAEPRRAWPGRTRSEGRSTF